MTRPIPSHSSPSLLTLPPFSPHPFSVLSLLDIPRRHPPSLSLFTIPPNPPSLPSLRIYWRYQTIKLRKMLKKKYILTYITYREYTGLDKNHPPQCSSSLLTISLHPHSSPFLLASSPPRLLTPHLILKPQHHSTLHTLSLHLNLHHCFFSSRLDITSDVGSSGFAVDKNRYNV